MKRSALKWFILAGIILCVLMAFIYAYNKPHRQVMNETPLLTIQAYELFTQYTADEKAANSLYLDKVLQVQGTVGEIIRNEQGETTLVLKDETEPFGVSCTMQQKQRKNISTIQVGDRVVIKGLCTGMLMDVVLVKCVQVE